MEAMVPSMAAVEERPTWAEPSILDIFLFLIDRIFVVVGALLMFCRLSLVMSYLGGCLSPATAGEVCDGVSLAACLKLFPLLTLLRAYPSISSLLFSLSKSECFTWLFLLAPRMLSLNSSVIVFKWFPCVDSLTICPFYSLLSFNTWCFFLMMF